MDLPESTVSPNPNQVYDRDKGEWVDIKDVPAWKIVLSDPMAVIIILGFIGYGLYSLYEWVRPFFE